MLKIIDIQTNPTSKVLTCLQLLWLISVQSHWHGLHFSMISHVISNGRFKQTEILLVLVFRYYLYIIWSLMFFSM